MFVDIAKVTIKSGNGGDGSSSFRREKYVPQGGPDGGDGGRGGDIVLQVDTGMHTLLDFQYRRKYEAQNGEPGSGRRRNGKSGEALTIQVPLGTVVREVKSGSVIADMNQADERRVILRGGRGGWGNVHYATPTRQAPAFAQPGQKTQAYEVYLELKSIADVGLVGFPNVGKSTILSMVTQARPKIANYPFTTLTPNLGVVRVDESSFHMADIPGLIENAHQGAGLGHDFLRHVERTRMLVHVIDVSGSEGRDPVDDFDKIMQELGRYSRQLAQRPQVVAANKMDIPGAQENLQRLTEHCAARHIDVFPVSAATNQGLSELMRRVSQLLWALPDDDGGAFDEQQTLESLEKGDTYHVDVRDGVFYVTGSFPQHLLQSVNLDDAVSMQYFEKRLYESGLVDELRRLGAQHEDTVDFGGMEFEFWD
ncbi:MAG: GTPase ObgE [Eubacteriales bacterium]|nr:GTPase ObgE [Eubacteriales bacterium]